MPAHRRLLLLVVAFLYPLGAAAQPQAKLEADASQQIRMEVGQTRLVHISVRVVRVSVADPAVADVQVVTPQQVLITAKSVGYTHLILWGVDDQPLVIAVSITRNLDQLRSQFSQLFPDQEIQVSAAGDLIVLSGTVTDLRLPARAAEVAQLHADRLANLIQVSGDQQVQLDVRFAEVSRSGMRRAGVNFLWRDSRRGHVAGMSTATTTPGLYLREDFHVPGTSSATGPPLVPPPSSGDAFNLFFSTGLSDFPFSAILSILTQEGLAKMLAEPTLVALSGQEAQFHAGGEVPILIAEQFGQISIRFKKFGVRLKFTPTVLGERTMSLKLGVEVSEPDPSSGVMVTGFQVPGFRTRSSETTIRLRDGQSFGIAGLLSDDVRGTVSKVPVLGELPILGALFSSKAFQREETELLMVVTAHLVRPLKPDEVPLLPGEDELNDPSDFQLFLMGSLGPWKKDNQRQRRGLRGSVQAQPGPTTPLNAPPRPDAPPPPKPGVDSTSPQNRSKPTFQKSERPNLQGPLGPVGFIRG